MRKIILSILFLSFTSACFAEIQCPASLIQGNAIIMRIYEEMQKIKGAYPKLASFDKNALKEDNDASSLRFASSSYGAGKKLLSIQYGSPWKQDKYTRDDRAIYLEIYCTANPFSQEPAAAQQARDFVPREIYVKELSLYLEYYIVTDEVLRAALESIIKDAVEKVAEHK
jgi:hypothetical protein